MQVELGLAMCSAICQLVTIALFISSGCITSAESVLITAQSQEELYRVLNENNSVPDNERKLVVVSLSPQSVASLAVQYGLSMDGMARRLSTFFKSLGVHYVLDTVFARDLALQETANEFVRRFRVSVSVSVRRVLCAAANYMFDAQSQAEGGKGELPMLASACPGMSAELQGDLCLRAHAAVVVPQGGCAMRKRRMETTFSRSSVRPSRRSR